jgi:hypothetical protein
MPSKSLECGKTCAETGAMRVVGTGRKVVVMEPIEAMEERPELG